MNNYLNIYTLIELYDREGVPGLKRKIHKRAFYAEDNYAGQIYEMVKNRKYKEIHEAITKIKKLIGK